MRLVFILSVVLFLSMTAWAQSESAVQEVAGNDSSPADSPGDPDPVPQVHPAATVYSHGFEVRRDIHKYASFATLPLFATEYFLAESLYKEPLGSISQSKRSAHIAIGTGIIGLFALNTFTGGLNLWEERHDTQGRKLKLAHGILMMAAEAGFAATAMTGPHGERRNRIQSIDTSNRARHRDIAIGSISVGTVGYLIMLLGHH
jgi:hypothetical protein